MKCVNLYFSNICILHKQEVTYLNKFKENLLTKGIDLNIKHFGIGYPQRLSEYLSKDDCILPDVIISTDLEIYEDKSIYSKFSNSLYPLINYFDIKPDIKNSTIYYDDRLLPFIIIPLVFCYNTNYIGNTNSILEVIQNSDKTIIGGINNSGAKSIIKAIWSKYGKDIATQFLENTQIMNMPIQAFNAVKKGSDRLSIVPLIYAKTANNKDLFMSYPKDGAIALPSYVCASKSLDTTTMLTVLSELLSEDFCNSFVKSGSLVSSLSNTADETTSLANNYKFIYPDTTWFDNTSSDEFYQLFKKYL
ncbi:MAG: hypothetical protein BEN19_07525 [Epulopiscium sp. Nuni2H_MBin003]|nr:MAG: hypothetical protein BEN19_07525 [Epulopiscium sp. Nuni2H_MBin003]